VPDLAEESRTLAADTDRLRRCVHRRLERETELIAGLPERLTQSMYARLRRDRADVDAARSRATARVTMLIEAAATDLDHLRARARALSPQATLDRGYAVVQRADGRIVRVPDEAVGRLHVRVAGGEFGADPVGPAPAAAPSVKSAR
jgi:exodeoxyribonuclease VII large subunit